MLLLLTLQYDRRTGDSSCGHCGRCRRGQASSGGAQLTGVLDLLGLHLRVNE